MLKWLRKALPQAATTTPEEQAAEQQRRGNALLDEGKLDEAVLCYRSATELSPNAERFVNLGYALMELGRTDEARAALEQSASLDPALFDAAYMLGTLARAEGSGTAAVRHFRQALALQPDSEMVLRDLCLALVQGGDAEGARQTAEQGITRHPQLPDFHFLLGNILAGLKKPEDAVASYRRALALMPDYPEAHCNMALTLQALGRNDEAMASYRQAIAMRPAYSQALCGLAGMLTDTGGYQEAARLCREALAANVDDPEAHNNLGNALLAMGRNEDAASHYRRAIALNEAQAQPHNNLGLALIAMEKPELAVPSIRRALEIDPDYASAHNNLGNALQKINLLEEAVVHYERAVALQPDFAKAHYNYAVALNAQGHHALAVARWRRTLELDPGYLDAWCGILFVLSYSRDCTPQQYLQEARGYGRATLAIAKPYTQWKVRRAPLRADEPLRVGFISGDMRQHPVGFFLEGVVKHIDPARVTLVAYSTNPIEDQVTARIKPHFSAWHLLVGVSDKAAAEKICADGIHILVDLAGLTALNRLPLFAWRAAPVQATWLGFFATTGIPGVDYFVADPTGVPEGHRDDFSETVSYMPYTRLCFTEPQGGDKTRPNELPALANGHITFGCYQNMTKLNDGVLALWARVFKALPTARLRHMSKQMADKASRELLAQRMEQAGIPQDRVQLLESVGREAYFLAHHEVDVMLDTYPYGGGTTTCESLWMGVPTITLAGPTLLSRQGASLLTSAGLADWVAETEDDYVARVVAHCSDLQALATLRSRLREQALASPLFDGKRFAADLEEVFHGMWREKGARPD